MYRKFGKNYETIFQDGFPIVENAVEPNYEIKLEIDPVLDDYDLVYIEGNGLLRDERTRSDFLSQSPFSFIIEDNAKYNDEGRIRLSYYMNSKTGLSEAIYLECSLQLEHEKKISVSIVNLKEDEKNNINLALTAFLTFSCQQKRAIDAATDPYAAISAEVAAVEKNLPNNVYQDSRYRSF